MDAVCSREDAECQMYALAGALHSLHLYCATITAALMCCCTSHKGHRRIRWRGQNIRGVASLVVGAVWWCGAAAALLRPGATVRLVASLMAPLAWLVAAVFHAALWSRKATAPVLYLAIYWLLAAVTSAALFYRHTVAAPGLKWNHMQIYIDGLSMLLSALLSAVDCVCFYDEIIKRYDNNMTSPKISKNISYKHNDVHFYSKITYFWLNSLLYKGYKEPLEENDFGEIHEKERSKKDYDKFTKIYRPLDPETSKNGLNIWQCYFRMVWPNFYIAGIFKLCGDLIGMVPALGLAVIIQYIQSPITVNDTSIHVTIEEFLTNGYVMLLIVTMALIGQAFLSQYSTHLVTVEGMRLKTALQSLVYNKCMRLAPWSATDACLDEELPLLHSHEDSITTRSGLITNLVSQDTYNIMSCVWICHYIWAIPLKVAVILYLLYRKLGISAIIGTAASVFILTPLQFYIGKKLSDNSKGLSKCTDHRISKMTEILQGINVIKLYVWEDLFKEKILQLREVELKLLNKDSIYWSFLTFTTQVSTLLITVITFTTYYMLENKAGLTAVNVFAGLAFFNQLTVPLLILPVTVLMVIQAVVSTRRIRDFINLPEANLAREADDDDLRKKDKFNDAFIDSPTEEVTFWDKDDNIETEDAENDDNFSEDETGDTSPTSECMISFKNAAFTWGVKDDSLLEIGNLDIPAGKLIMIVGATGSGKSSFLSACLGEMFLERGDVHFNGPRSTWYAGQPPWLLEASVRENIVMDSPWCQRRYARVLRATGLRPDLHILSEGDATKLGSHGAPLSGGQRVRVCVARALYSSARLLALDEPLGALDAPLARHVVARGLVPAARAGRTVMLATNRLELMHYAHLILVMEDGRVAGFGRAGSDGNGVLCRWARLAGEARAAAARAGAGPPGGAARERSRLVRALSRPTFNSCASDDHIVGISEVAGAHLLSEVPTCVGGSWKRATIHPRPSLSRQFSSPPLTLNNSKCGVEVRRALSAGASSAALGREASFLRRWLWLRPRPRPHPRPHPHPHRTLTRWTPRKLRRLISSDSAGSQTGQLPNNESNMENAADSVLSSLTSNGVETVPGNVVEKASSSNQDSEEPINEHTIWREYGLACGWWGAAYWAAAAGAQALAVAGDCWLTHIISAAANSSQHTHAPDTWSPTTAWDQSSMWGSVSVFALLCACCACALCVAQAAGAAAGARARRALHERLLHAALHAPHAHHHATPLGYTLHRFSSDIHVIDKKLPTAISRWAQLMLICVAAILVNAVAVPWSVLALLPAVLCYLMLQSVYLCNARELQRSEGLSAAGVVSLCAQTFAGAATVRAGRLQPRMRTTFFQRLDTNHNVLLLLNAANRWLGLSLDLVGAASVCVSLGVALCGGSAASAGLAGAYSLLLPAYLAHLAKCRADLDQQLAALERVHADANVPQEDYREHCEIPAGWQRNGKIKFENVSIRHEPGSTPILNDINLTVGPGEKLAICGRSGSGKSTLLLACVGAATISSGRILLDGVDITRVPLRTLRHRVVVLPQELAMFSGTLRENLDPLAVHTDEEIWSCLRAVGLVDFVTAQPAGLECSIERCRGGWSVGRVGRACAARAALHAAHASALLLDEPAAALDAPAERALLAAMAALAPHTTVITVAHRVSSVRGYDRAVVLEEGRAAEQGSVGALLSQPSSRLARMLAAAHHRIH